MSDSLNKGRLFAAILWIAILAVAAVAFKMYILPSRKAKLTEATGSESQYKIEIAIGIDSFSGYAPLRSDTLRNDMRSAGIRLRFEDDKADYGKRIKALQNGTIQMATFTIDALILASLKLGDYPGTIVLVLDESNGADAIVAYKSGVKSVQDLDSGEARIVVTENSPSEFVARTMIAHFNLPNLPPSWMISADGSAAVYRKLKGTNPNEKYAFGLWEPYLSQALENPDIHVLLDSSRLRGLLVDVLVVQRQFLREKPELVRQFVEAYLRSIYSCERQSDGMLNLVVADSKAAGGEVLDRKNAEKLVKGVRWKNTLENYGHFGLDSQSQASNAHIEDIIGNIVQVLVATGVISDGLTITSKANLLFFDQILRDIKGSDFHPSRRLNVISGVSLGSSEQETIRNISDIAALTEEQWQTVMDVGQMKVAPIVFGRASAKISIQSQRDLTELGIKLKQFPGYYLQIDGAMNSAGDIEQNKKLAMDRAVAVVEFLKSAGVHQNRMRAVTSVSTGSDMSRSVSIRVGQLPY